MRSEPKLRPSMTTKELALISECLDFRVQYLVTNGQSNNAALLDMVKLKQYCDSLQPKVDQSAALLAQYLQQAGQVNLATVQPSVTIVDQCVSPIDNPALTDDQRFDLLSLRDEKHRTEAENKWYLNVGTFIRMARASKQTVDTDDL